MRSTKVRHLPLVLAAIFMVVASAGKAETVLLRTLDETVREAATISGVVVVGAMFLPEGPDREPRLAARLDPAWSGRILCVEVISADGLYQSQSVYDLSEGVAGVTLLPYPTEYADRLRSMGPGVISVRGRLDGCDTKDGVVPVAWRPANVEGPSRVALQINSFRADSVQVFVGDDPMAEAIFCEPAPAAVRTAFDTICAFDLPSPLPERLTVEILRLSGGVAEQPEFVDLVLAR
jgi:hypothetical protein